MSGSINKNRTNEGNNKLLNKCVNAFNFIQFKKKAIQILNYYEIKYVDKVEHI